MAPKKNSAAAKKAAEKAAEAKKAVEAKKAAEAKDAADKAKKAADKRKPLAREPTAAEKAAEEALSKEVRVWSSLKLIELRTKCGELGVEYKKNDTKQMIASKLVFAGHPPPANLTAPRRKGARKGSGKGKGSDVGDEDAESADDREFENRELEDMRRRLDALDPITGLSKRKAGPDNRKGDDKKQKTVESKEAESGSDSRLNAFTFNPYDGSASAHVDLTKEMPSLRNPAVPNTTTTSKQATPAPSPSPLPPVAATDPDRMAYEALRDSNIDENMKFLLMQRQFQSRGQPPNAIASADATAASTSSSANSIAEFEKKFPGLRSYVAHYPQKHIKSAIEGQYVDLQHFLLPSPPSLKPYSSAGRGGAGGKMARVAAPPHFPSAISVYNPNTNTALTDALGGGVTLGSIPLHFTGGASSSSAGATLNITSSNTQTRKLLTFFDWLEAFQAYTGVVFCDPSVKGRLSDSYLQHLHLMSIAVRDFGFDHAYAYDIELRSRCSGFKPLEWNDPILLHKLSNDYALSAIASVTRQNAPPPKPRAQAIADVTGYTFSSDSKHSSQVCFNFNSPNGCRFASTNNCKRRHVCAHCQSDSHSFNECKEPGRPPTFDPSLYSNQPSSHSSSTRGGGGGVRGGRGGSAGRRGGRGRGGGNSNANN